MGVPKRDHLQRIISSPAVSQRWLLHNGTAPGAADVDAMFTDFVRHQLECIVGDSAVIDGVPETIARLRERGIKIGSTTGYTREMMDLLTPAAAENGYRADCVVTPDDVGGGRPHPWMIFQNTIQLRVDHLTAVVKIGDTISDIEEGLNAGVWTIGVARTGNLIGMTATDFASLPLGEREIRLTRAHTILREAGAHDVIDSVAECELSLDRIEDRMRDGQLPTDRA
jgi:phosphonoacetaldehyde hydrolase